MTRQSKSKRKEDALRARSEIGKLRRQARADLKRAIRRANVPFASVMVAAHKVKTYGFAEIQLTGPDAIRYDFR